MRTSDTQSHFAISQATESAFASFSASAAQPATSPRMRAERSARCIGEPPLFVRRPKGVKQAIQEVVNPGISCETGVGIKRTSENPARICHRSTAVIDAGSTERRTNADVLVSIATADGQVSSWPSNLLLFPTPDPR